jgi:hypothetical protein
MLAASACGTSREPRPPLRLPPGMALGIPIIEGWDGVHWTAMPSRLQPGVTDPTLSGVAAVQPGYAWAVGYAHNYNYRPITLIEKWNGTNWQQVTSPNP